jgi:flagellar hook-basal body complex protein FliE
MTVLAAIAPVAGLVSPSIAAPVRTPAVGGAGFGDLLVRGLNAVDARVAQADALVASFAKGDGVPLHQVALALQDAKIAIDLATQVRTRLLESYRDFMNMQL